MRRSRDVTKGQPAKDRQEDENHQRIGGSCPARGRSRTSPYSRARRCSRTASSRRDPNPRQGRRPQARDGIRGIGRHGRSASFGAGSPALAAGRMVRCGDFEKERHERRDPRKLRRRGAVPGDPRRRPEAPALHRRRVEPGGQGPPRRSTSPSPWRSRTSTRSGCRTSGFRILYSLLNAREDAPPSASSARGPTWPTRCAGSAGRWRRSRRGRRCGELDVVGLLAPVRDDLHQRARDAGPGRDPAARGASAARTIRWWSRAGPWSSTCEPLARFPRPRRASATERS